MEGRKFFVVKQQTNFCSNKYLNKEKQFKSYINMHESRHNAHKTCSYFIEVKRMT